jgi:hypothetical protein
MRRHVLLALKASHLAVAERCVLGVLGEPAARDRLRDPLLDGRGQRRHQSGGRRPVGCDAAAFIPLSEAAGAQNERWEAMAQRRSVCQGASYVVVSNGFRLQFRDSASSRQTDAFSTTIWYLTMIHMVTCMRYDRIALEHTNIHAPARRFCAGEPGPRSNGFRLRRRLRAANRQPDASPTTRWCLVVISMA